VKVALTYSKACSPVKIIASTTVITSAKTASILLPAVIAWCAYVTVAPEHNKIKVFKRGTSIGSKVSIPLGGQMDPSSITGASAAAKKAQKKAKKNITSDTINKSIPYRNPSCTMFVWCPSKVDSLTTSRHHKNIHKRIVQRPKKVASRPP
jgi:hypothetical protein